MNLSSSTARTSAHTSSVYSPAAHTSDHTSDQLAATDLLTLTPDFLHRFSHLAHDHATSFAQLSADISAITSALPSFSGSQLANALPALSTQASRALDHCANSTHTAGQAAYDLSVQASHCNDALAQSLHNFQVAA